MVPQARSEATRQKILDAAIDLFSEVGYAAAGLGEIIECAGMTKGALYHHFDLTVPLGECAARFTAGRGSPHNEGVAKCPLTTTRSSRASGGCSRSRADAVGLLGDALVGFH